MALVFLGLTLPAEAVASWNLSADVDARYRWEDRDDYEANLHRVGASVRKTFADDRGDRFILFALVEAEDDFDEIIAHEFYGQYKGPLGAWSLTTGRFGLPGGFCQVFRHPGSSMTCPTTDSWEWMWTVVSRFQELWGQWITVFPSLRVTAPIIRPKILAMALPWAGSGSPPAIPMKFHWACPRPGAGP